jgi:hypothetical protein
MSDLRRFNTSLPANLDATRWIAFPLQKLFRSLSIGFAHKKSPLVQDNPNRGTTTIMWVSQGEAP